MLQLVAILFFSGLFVGLALVLQFTIRDSWQDMIAALLGRPMARHRVTAPAAVQASVPRSRRPRHAAA